MQAPVEPAASPARRLVTMGRVLGAHGVKGALMVASYCEPARRLLDYSRWWLRQGDTPRAVALLGGQHSAKGLIVELDGISDRDAANALRGTEVAIERELLPPLRKGQYYWADLEGLRVVNGDGTELGHVDHLFDNGAHPVLVVRDGLRERMIPFVVDRHVLEVDLSSGLIRVDWDADF